MDLLPEQWDWLAKHLAVKDCKVFSKRPWAETYRITHANGVAWLKYLPPALRSAVIKVPKISARFPAQIPETIATDTSAGLLLVADHGGTDLPREISEKERTRLLVTYAKIQAQSAVETEIMATLPSITMDALINNLLIFLSNDDELPAITDASVTANHFFSSGRARKYHEALKLRAPLLTEFLSAASSLPFTLNHCDLRSANAAVTDDENLIIFDWDEATAGPAGLSLHAMFSGASALLPILDGQLLVSNPEDQRQVRREIDAYIDTLINQGYGDRQTLPLCVASAAVAGMLHYIVSFSCFPGESRRYRKSVRRNLIRRLSDLLDVCDYLCLSRDYCVLEFAEDYMANGREKRAKKLLTIQAELRPDMLNHLALGRLLRDHKHTDNAIDVFRNGLKLHPDSTETKRQLNIELGVAYLESGRYKKARRCLSNALTVAPDERAMRKYHTSIELQTLLKEASKPGTVPTVKFSDEELRTGQFTPERLHLCEQLFRDHGVLLLKDIYNRDTLTECLTAFSKRYKRYLSDTRHKDALRIGDKRFQITIDIKAPYNETGLIGNSLLLPLMKRLVGQDCILGCFTSSMSLPGSEDQRLHKDHKALFYDEPTPTRTSSFAVTAMVPLVDVNERVGTTRVKKGSHRLTSEESKELPYQTPYTELGDCYLMDYRLSHHGQANTSDKPRPILSLVYQRPWFRDYINFKNQPSLRIESKEYKKLPKELRSILGWTNEPRPK